MRKASLFLIILVLAFTVLLCGCESDKGNNNTNTNTNNSASNAVRSDVRPQEIALAVMAEVEIPSAAEKKVDDIQFFISELDTENIKEMSYHICASGAYPDELLIIEFYSDTQAKAARTAVLNRLNSRKDDFADYAPAEMYKFDDAATDVVGEWLFFYITRNNTKVKEIISSYF